MIAADTSTISAFLDGEEAEDTLALEHAIRQQSVLLPPVVVTELLSKRPARGRGVRELTGALQQIPLLGIQDGYWERAGRLRASLLSLGKKARLAAVLIAQSCLDHNVALITRDADFRYFQAVGLTVIPAIQ